MKPFFYFSLVFLFSAFSACKSGKTSANSSTTSDRQEPVEQLSEPATEKIPDDNQEGYAPLIGSWIWVKTECCGRMKQETSPQKGEPERIIIFDAKGNVEARVGGAVEKSGKFFVRKGNIYPDRYEILVPWSRYPALLVLNNDSLMFNWEYMDLQKEYFVRTWE